MKGQSIISPNAPRARTKQPSGHEARRRQGSARDGAIARLRREGVKATRGWTNIKLAQVVAEHTGVPMDGDWVEYLLQFATGGQAEPGAAAGRMIDVMHAPPMHTSLAMRMAQERASAVQPSLRNILGR